MKKKMSLYHIFFSCTVEIIFINSGVFGFDTDVSNQWIISCFNPHYYIRV